ncbi:MAG: hypothetical protein MH321_16620 [Leptospiraceae bacterium]|nr:hypothetical protein [Leptospiraceae bacterium]
MLVYIEKITELDEFSDFDQAQPIGSSRDSTAFIPPQNQEYFKRMIISEIVKCRCVETVHVLIKDGETIDEIRKQYSNVISTKIRYHYNPGRTFLAYFITSISLFLIPTWNSVYVSNEFEIYSPKSKVPEKMKIEYAETTYRHLVFLPWLFTDENSQYSFYTHRIPGAYRNAMEEAYNKGIFLIEK